MFTALLLSLLLLLSSSTSSTSQPIPCVKKDAAALLDIKRSLRNPDLLSSWNYTVKCCSWDGIMCDPMTGRVTQLDIDISGIPSGPISPSIARLSSLNTLFLSTNIIGTIPPSIGTLTHLFIFKNPCLTGTIPKSLCNLHNLIYLDLSENNLVGSLPDCFGTNLAMVDLRSNRLSGPIPANFMQGITILRPTPRLFLGGNILSGPILASLRDVPLTSIDLSNNKLTGDASFFFREKGSLEDIDLSRNELEFDLSKVQFPLRMQTQAGA